MKKKLFITISVILLLTLFTFTSPIKATDYAGHDFSEDYFAVEIDLYPDAVNPDVIYDLGTNTAGTDTYPDDDLQFYMNYMNESGIEVAYSALEKMEHWIKFKDLLPDKVVDVLSLLGTYGGKDLNAALDAEIFHINATAPFQQVVQHFNTPWGSEAFVTNNFMTLVAYSAGTGSDPTLMDSGDELYMGYTFAVQNVTDVINDVLETQGESYRIPHYDYEANFEVTSTGYKFGINYTNMFVLWQALNVSLRGPDILSAAGLNLPPTKGVIYGQDIVAASVLDHLAFEYTFEVKEIDLGTTPPITVNLGTVETKYHIGETNFLITQDDDTFIASHLAEWEGTPFTATPVYTVDIPDELEGLDLPDPDGPGPLPDLPAFPGDIPITFPKMAFFVGNDAKIRMKMANAFGLTIATATNWFDIQIIDQPQYATHLDDPEDPTIELEKDGNVFFWTSFKNKMHYKLRELEFWGIDPTTSRDVYVKLFDPTGWAITGIAKDYFLVEFHLAFGFTVFVATKIAPEITYPGTHVVLLDRLLYLTFTEFPEWYGGEIYHDPAYSAVAAVAAVDDTDTEPEDGGIPGFEFLTVLLAIPTLYALYRKRR